MPDSSQQPPNKFRSAIDVLNQVRRRLLDDLADRVLEMSDEFVHGGFQVNEFLEVHGARLHFLCLMIGQFELEAEALAAAEASRSKSKSTAEHGPETDQPLRVEDPPPAREDDDPTTSSSSEEAGNDV